MIKDNFFRFIPESHHTSLDYIFYCLKIFFITYIVFYFLKNFSFSTDHKRTMLLVFSLITFISLSLYSVRYQSFSPAIKIVTRAIIGLFIFYGATAYPSLIPNNAEQRAILNIYLFMQWVSIPLAIIGLWRPVLALPLLMLMLWQREFALAFYDQKLSYTDNLVVSELGIVLILGMAVLSVVNHLTNTNDPRHKLAGKDDIVWKMPSPSEILLLIVVAMHFTNYFNSGIKKLVLGPEWFSWTLDSPTQEIILMAHVQNMLPISHIEWLWQGVYVLFDRGIVWFNLITTLSQLIAVVAICRIKWTIWLTILYDISHVVIYISSGIFFWKWIVLNSALVIALAMMRERKMLLLLPIVLVAVVTIGGKIMLFFPSLNSTVYLGWYETSMATTTEIYAVTDEGKSYRVPSNYFLRSSVAIAQDQFENAARINMGFATYSQTTSHELVAQAEQCAIEPQNVPSEIYTQQRAMLDEYLNNHQRYIVSVVDADGYINYDLYPHHIWSNPFELQDFKQLDKRTITGFQVVFRSICMEYNNGEIETKEVAKDEFYVPYRKGPI